MNHYEWVNFTIHWLENFSVKTISCIIHELHGKITQAVVYISITSALISRNFCNIRKNRGNYIEKRKIHCNKIFSSNECRVKFFCEKVDFTEFCVKMVAVKFRYFHSVYLALNLNFSFVKKKVCAMYRLVFLYLFSKKFCKNKKKIVKGPRLWKARKLLQV